MEQRQHLLISQSAASRQPSSNLPTLQNITNEWPTVGCSIGRSAPPRPTIKTEVQPNYSFPSTTMHFASNVIFFHPCYFVPIKLLFSNLTSTNPQVLFLACRTVSDVHHLQTFLINPMITQSLQIYKKSLLSP